MGCLSTNVNEHAWDVVVTYKAHTNNIKGMVAYIEHKIDKDEGGTRQVRVSLTPGRGMDVWKNDHKRRLGSRTSVTLTRSR